MRTSCWSTPRNHEPGVGAYVTFVSSRPCILTRRTFGSPDNSARMLRQWLNANTLWHTLICDCSVSLLCLLERCPGSMAQSSQSHRRSDCSQRSAFVFQLLITHLYTFFNVATATRISRHSGRAEELIDLHHVQVHGPSSARVTSHPQLRTAGLQGQRRDPSLRADSRPFPLYPHTVI
jgi:hypothetical protein